MWIYGKFREGYIKSLKQNLSYPNKMECVEIVSSSYSLIEEKDI